MTAVSGSASQYSSRSLLDTSALLPTLTKDERPTRRSIASCRIAMPSAPLCDEKATRPAVGTMGENPRQWDEAPVQQAERNHRRLTLGVARVAEGVNERPVRIGQLEEPQAARLGGQLVEEAPQRGAVCRPRDTERCDGAVKEHRTRVDRIGRRSRRGHDVHRAAFVTAMRASGSTNSRSGWRTVSTGHGAMRTTCSATLPISRWAMAPRPCVPITIRLMALLFA